MTAGATARPIVIGSGLGGLLGAAVLTRAGLKPLILERLSFFGGKFTQIKHDGFQVPTGAFHSLPGGPYGRLGRLFIDLGLDVRYREPRPAGFLFDGERRLSLPFPFGCALRRDGWLRTLPLRERGRMLRLLFTILKTRRPVPDVTYGEYVRRFSDSPAVHEAIDACVRYADGVGIDEVSARDVVYSLRLQRGHFHGIILGGCGAVIRQLTDLLRRQGAELQAECAATAILVRDGRVHAVVDERGRERLTDLVIANAPPRDTVRLLGAACPEELRRLAENLRPAHGITHGIRTSQPLTPEVGGDFPVGVGGRIAGCAPVSNADPSLAPAGMNFALAYQPLREGEAPAAAIAAGREELKRLYPILTEESFFHTSVFHDGWPAAFVAQAYGQHGDRRVPLHFPEIANLFLLSHSSVGYGLAADVIGDAVNGFQGLLGAPR